MNKNFRVITINGIRGMIVAVFIVMGLIAGFVISPGWLCMTLWNLYAENAGNIALMNLIQGIMLWAIIALSLYALNNKRALIGFGSYSGLPPEQIKDIISKTKMSEDKIRQEIEMLTKELQEKNDKIPQEIQQSTEEKNPEDNNEKVEEEVK